MLYAYLDNLKQSLSIEDIITLLCSGKFINTEHIKRNDNAINIYTNEHRYTIVLTNQYLGAFANCRKPYPGEEYTRGNDLGDGPNNIVTFISILLDIISYETIAIHKKPKPKTIKVDESKTVESGDIVTSQTLEEVLHKGNINRFKIIGAEHIYCGHVNEFESNDYFEFEIILNNDDNEMYLVPIGEDPILIPRNMRRYFIGKVAKIHTMNWCSDMFKQFGAKVDNPQKTLPVFSQYGFEVTDIDTKALLKHGMNDKHYSAYIQRIIKTAFFLANETIIGVSNEKSINMKNFGKKFKLELSIPIPGDDDFKFLLTENDICWHESEDIPGE